MLLSSGVLPSACGRAERYGCSFWRGVIDTEDPRPGRFHRAGELLRVLSSAELQLSLGQELTCA